MALLNSIGAGVGHQRFHYWVAGCAGKGFGYFGLPPRQFGGSYAGIGSVVHHIVYLAAKGIKRSNCGTPCRG